MTVKEAQEMSIDEFKALSPAKQKQATQVLADAYNKRLKRLEAHEGGKGSPAYQSKVSQITEKGRFSTKGKSGKELAAEFTRAQYFGGLKTSTVSGYEEYQEKITGKLQDRQHGGQLSKNLANSAWDAFNRMKEQFPSFLRDGSDASDQLVKYLSNEIIGNKKYNTFGEGELERMLQEKATELYEAGQVNEGFLIEDEESSDWMGADFDFEDIAEDDYI